MRACLSLGGGGEGPAAGRLLPSLPFPSPPLPSSLGEGSVKVTSLASQPHHWSWGMGGCGASHGGGVPQPLLTPWPATQRGLQQALGRQDTRYLSQARRQSGFYFNSPAEMSTHPRGAGGTAGRAQGGAPPRAWRTPPSSLWPGCTCLVGLERVCGGPERGRVSENGLAEIGANSPGGKGTPASGSPAAPGSPLLTAAARSARPASSPADPATLAAPAGEPGTCQSGSQARPGPPLPRTDSVLAPRVGAPSPDGAFSTPRGQVVGMGPR